MQKRVLILIDTSCDPKEVKVYSSARVLLQQRPEIGCAYGTLMNHLSRKKEPYIKGPYEIHRVDIQRAEKGA